MTLNIEALVAMVGRLEVKYLAPPQLLRSDLTVYVVCTRPVGSNEWQTVGQLLVNDDRTGSVKIRVPYATCDVSISGESTGAVTQPSDRALRGMDFTLPDRTPALPESLWNP